MAYNVLKGIVEGSVDQHADQEIEGIKVFKSTISASMFYDTDAGAPCATENNVAITNLTSETKYGILTYQGSKIAKSNYNLTFDGETLCADRAVIGTLSGCGRELKNVPAEYLSGKVQAQSINHGAGLEDLRGVLKIKCFEGIKSNDEGISVDLSPNGALDIRDKKIFINPNNCLNIQEYGQNISDPDLLLMYDASRGEVRHSTLKNLYEGFLKFKTPAPAGAKNCIQYKGAKTFEANNALTFEPSSSTLNVNGTAKVLNLQSNNKILIHGSIYKSIKMIRDPEYSVADIDNTILCNTSDNVVLLMLPLARDHAGRVITVKKVCDDDDKYKIRGNHILKIRTNGELIDFSSEIILKSTYSTRVLHSDGNKWWIINKTGS